MSETKWTPGPWSWWPSSIGGVVTQDATATHICVPTHRDARTANAHLIAAAPELYEALRKAEQLAEVADDWNLPEVEIDGEMVSTIVLRDEFRAALARARGEQP